MVVSWHLGWSQGLPVATSSSTDATGMINIQSLSLCFWVELCECVPSALHAAVYAAVRLALLYRLLFHTCIVVYNIMNNGMKLIMKHH